MGRPAFCEQLWVHYATLWRGGQMAGGAGNEGTAKTQRRKGGWSTKDTKWHEGHEGPASQGVVVVPETLGNEVAAPAAQILLNCHCFVAGPCSARTGDEAISQCVSAPIRLLGIASRLRRSQ